MGGCVCARVRDCENSHQAPASVLWREGFVSRFSIPSPFRRSETHCGLHLVAELYRAGDTYGSRGRESIFLEQFCVPRSNRIESRGLRLVAELLYGKVYLVVRKYYKKAVRPDRTWCVGRVFGLAYNIRIFFGISLLCVASRAGAGSRPRASPKDPSARNLKDPWIEVVCRADF